MEGYNMNDGDMIELPPGFRFHPTDEELVTHYLSHKVLDCNFSTKAVGEVNLNKVEPWDLPWKAKLGEKDWYFFCARDRKYPSGSRTNRATNAGYWKATGKDKAIFRAKILVGMKKTLVFYRGRAPKGEKTNWVMHEYRLERKNSNIPPKTAKKEWVICRVFKKSSGGNKVHILMLERTHDHRLDLPPLMDLSSYENTTVPINTIAGPHVSCFSNLNQEFQEESVPKYSSSDMNSIFSSQINPSEENFHCPDSILKQEQETVSHIFRRNSPYMERNSSAEFSQDIGVNAKISSTITKYEYELTAYDDDQDFPIISTAQIDLDCLWNY